MKRQIPVLLLTMSFVLAGCKRDGEVNTILAAIDSFTTELITRIDTAPAPSAGVDDAQLYLDGRKSEIIAKMRILKGLRGYQVTDETKQKVAARLVDDASKIADLKIKYISQAMNDPAFDARLDKLVKDYQALLTHSSASD